MIDRLDGRTVLVTRPEHQSAELVHAIETAGGRASLFPVMDIVPRERDEFVADLEAMGSADVTIFVSANAVRHGLEALGAPTCRVAAIGPATALALEQAGHPPDIVPQAGFSSEHLLRHPDLENIGGQRITIVRGERGRELLGTTLRHRGAAVNYLSAYATRPHVFSQADLDALDAAFGRREIDATIIMSVATLDRLLDVLPDSSLDRLAGTRLVAPGARVIQTLEDRFPGAHCIEAQAPGADAMVAALAASYEEKTE